MNGSADYTAKEFAATLRNAAVEQQRAVREADWRMWHAAEDAAWLGGDGVLGFGDEGVELLRALLIDRNAHVRFAAARFLVWRDEKAARAAMRALLKQRNMTGFLAHEYLAMWEEGKMQVPPSMVAVKRRS